MFFVEVVNFIRFSAQSLAYQAKVFSDKHGLGEKAKNQLSKS